jgi:hypothetical protein
VILTDAEKRSEGDDQLHFVRPEIRYLKQGEHLTLREQAQGWTERIFQGRPAIEREICMDCMNGNYIRRQLNAEQRRKARALEQDQQGGANFFLLLADVDGAY